MAAIAAVEDIEDTGVLEAADALLSVRLEFSCMFAGDVESSRYCQCSKVENLDMSEAN
jgi:hypothetical protein